jgi:hypothetical protein
VAVNQTAPNLIDEQRPRHDTAAVFHGPNMRDRLTIMMGRCVFSAQIGTIGFPAATRDPAPIRLAPLPSAIAQEYTHNAASVWKNLRQVGVWNVDLRGLVWPVFCG